LAICLNLRKALSLLASKGLISSAEEEEEFPSSLLGAEEGSWHQKERRVLIVVLASRGNGARREMYSDKFSMRLTEAAAEEAAVAGAAEETESRRPSRVWSNERKKERTSGWTFLHFGCFSKALEGRSSSLLKAPEAV
jgi:hypothetical protein